MRTALRARRPRRNLRIRTRSRRSAMRGTARSWAVRVASASTASASASAVRPGRARPVRRYPHRGTSRLVLIGELGHAGVGFASEKRIDFAFRPFRAGGEEFRRRTPVRRSATARGVARSLAHPPDRGAAAVRGLGRDRAAARAFPGPRRLSISGRRSAPGGVAVRIRIRLRRAARVRDVPARGPGWAESRAVLPTLPRGNGSPLFLRGAAVAHRRAVSPRNQARSAKSSGSAPGSISGNQRSFPIDRWHGSRPAWRR